MTLSPMPPGGPHELAIIGKDTIRLKNVMVGEVWICSGQSNMEWPVARAINHEAEIADANYPNIRLFSVEHESKYQAQSDVKSQGWQICNPTTIPDFSAVGYFFSRNLHPNLDGPVGLIHTSWGGSVVEAWTSATSIAAGKELSDGTLQRYDLTADPVFDSWCHLVSG